MQEGGEREREREEKRKGERGRCDKMLTAVEWVNAIHRNALYSSLNFSVNLNYLKINN